MLVAFRTPEASEDRCSQVGVGLTPRLLEDADGLWVGDVGIQGLPVDGQDLVPLAQPSVPGTMQVIV